MSWLISQALMRDFESLHCSPEQAAEFSAGTCSDGEQSAPSSGSPIPQAYLSPDRMTDFSRPSQFGMTFAPLMDDRGAELLTWYLAGFHARTSAPQEPVKGSMASDPACGRRWPGSLAKYDRDSSSWKTAQRSLLEGLGECSVIWHRSGSMRSGMFFPRNSLAPTISASASGSLPTPTKSWGRRGPGISANPDKLRASPLGVRACLAIVKAVGWRWPASFVEWMMGWPVQWTALRPLETAKFREWQQQHSPSCPRPSMSDAA